MHHTTMEDPPYQYTHPCVACTTVERAKKFSDYLGRFRFGSQEFQLNAIPTRKMVLAPDPLKNFKTAFLNWWY